MGDDPTSEEIDFETLCALEPALRALEEDVRAVRDDGTGPFFCSNFLWLPLDGRLKSLVGTDRRRFHPRAGEPAVLHESRAYEAAYLRLSRLMPPCRDCGCRGFHPYREAQVRAGRDGRGSPGDPRRAGEATLEEAPDSLRSGREHRRP